MQKTLDQLIEDIAQHYDVPAHLLREMLRMERGKLYLEKRRGLVADLQELIQQEVEES